MILTMNIFYIIIILQCANLAMLSVIAWLIHRHTRRRKEHR